MRLHRLIGIIMLLDSRKMVKAKDLAKILEASERTIYRDVDILCEAGIPIVSTPGPYGGFSIMEGYKFNSTSLQQEDILNIFLSGRGVNAEKNTETYQQVKNAIIKLENNVPKEFREEIAKAKEKFFLDSEPWWGKKIENKNIDTIKKAVLDLKKINIHYKKYNGEISQRIIRPYGVVIKNSQWYIIAFCETRNELRVFKSNRIQSAEMLQDNFNMPIDFSLEDFWKNSKEHFIGQPPLNESKQKHNTYPVKVKFFEEKNKMLQGFDVIDFSMTENSYIYDINMISFETACTMLFPLCDRIEILEPYEVKKYVLDKAKKILNINLKQSLI